MEKREHEERVGRTTRLLNDAKFLLRVREEKLKAEPDNFFYACLVRSGRDLVKEFQIQLDNLNNHDHPQAEIDKRER